MRVQNGFLKKKRLMKYVSSCKQNRNNLLEVLFIKDIEQKIYTIGTRFCLLTFFCNKGNC